MRSDYFQKEKSVTNRGYRLLGKSLLLVIMSTLFACTKYPPTFKWHSTEDATIIIDKGPFYHKQNWFRCGWTSTCPAYSWNWCIRMIPHTAKRAWDDFTASYPYEFRVVTGFKEEGVTSPYSEAYKKKVKESTCQGCYGDAKQVQQQADTIARIERLMNLREENPDQWENAILTEFQNGNTYHASYVVIRAGKPGQERNWFMEPDPHNTCFNVYGNNR